MCETFGMPESRFQFESEKLSQMFTFNKRVNLSEAFCNKVS